MNDNYVTNISFYPEEIKDAIRILKKLDDISCFIIEQHEDARKQYNILKETIDKHFPFICYSIFDKQEVDPMKQAAEIEIIRDSIMDRTFIRLLQKLSLTNRIVHACEKCELPESLITRLRMCITVFRFWMLADEIKVTLK